MRPPLPRRQPEVEGGRPPPLTTHPLVEGPGYLPPLSLARQRGPGGVGASEVTHLLLPLLLLLLPPAGAGADQHADNNIVII